MHEFVVFFLVLASVQQSTADRNICASEPDTGPCGGAFLKWYYSEELGKCTSFLYGGCFGNKNNFDSKEECELFCDGSNEFDRGDCFLDADSGLCEAAIERYYYNSANKACEIFIYGGCDGNNNNFKTESECEAACGNKTANEICKLEADTGPCEALIPRYFFNFKTKQCETFIYGGCDGNANNFEFKSDCLAVCAEECGTVPCSPDPCGEAKCEAHPEAKCVANNCNGCEAEFFLDNKPVTCKKPQQCIESGMECSIPEDDDSGFSLSFSLPCCEGTTCCSPSPPVIEEGYVPPRFGACNKSCISPTG